MIRIGLVTLLLFWTTLSFSQDLIYKTITVNDGLPSSEIYDILQDQKGFVWISSDNGLARYNGRDFKIYSKKDGLGNNCVLRIHEDEIGLIWVKTIASKISFIQNYQIKPYQYYIKPYKNAISELELIGVDEAGKKWMRAREKQMIYREVKKDTFEIFNPKIKKQYVSYFIKPLQNQNIIHDCLYTDSLHSNYTLEKKNGFIVLNGPFKKVKQFSNHFNFYRLRNGQFIGFNANGDYIQFGDNKINAIGKTGISGLINFYEDKSGNFWILTKDGLALFNKGNLNEAPLISLKGNYISGMIEDTEGNYWFINHTKGVYRTSSTNFRQLNFLSNFEDKKIASLKSRNGKLWFASKHGEIWQVDKYNTPSFIFYDSREISDFYPFEVLPNDMIVLPGLRLVSSHTKKINNQNYFGIHANYKSIDLFDDHIWVGYTSGFLGYKIPKLNKHNIRFHNTKYDKLTIKASKHGNRTNAILADKDQVWIGTAKGLFIVNSDTIIQSKAINSELLTSRIMSLKFYDNQHILIGTRGEGLLIYNKITAESIQIDERVGLVSDMVKCVFKKNQTIFIGTNKGLSILYLNDDLSIKKIINCDTYNGLPSNEINDIIFYNGKIWLATNNGLVYFDESKLSLNHSPPPIYINGIVVEDSTHSYATNELQLSANERNLTFLYEGIGYRAKNKIKYKYILTGESDTTFTESNEARYTNLTPGHHSFCVWAKNEDGFWSKHSAKFSFFIPKKFEETMIFYLIIILLFFAILLLILYFFYKRNKARHYASLQTSKLKQNALTALMNPHFIYNCLAAIQHFINTGNQEKSNLYLTRFSKLIRQNLNSIRQGNICLEDEIERLKLYLEIEKMRFREKLNYDIRLDEGLDPLDIQIPSMLLQPFVENAIWHGILPLDKPGLILIKFKMIQDDLLEINIEDNGVGINNALNKGDKKHHTSLSLAITKERLELLGHQTGKASKIEIKEINPEKGEGTSVYLVIPVSDT